MLHRFILGSVAILALVAFVSQATLAQQKDKAKTHTGTLIKVGDNQLTMTETTGKNQHTHKVPPTAVITCDGKDCKLADLKAGFSVTVTYEDNADKTATKIQAKSKAK
jgi:hypothetical protein